MKKFKIKIIARTHSTTEVHADDVENALNVVHDIYVSSEKCTYEIDSIEEIIDEN